MGYGLSKIEPLPLRFKPTTPFECSAGPAEAIWVWYGKMGYVVEARSVDLYIARSAEKFFHGHFSVAWMGSRSTFALHCHCCLVSVQSVTVSLSTWKGNVRCAGS